MLRSEEYDPLSKDVKLDQHSWFATLRAECPVHHHTMPQSEINRQNATYIVASPTHEFWSVFDYETAERILQDNEGFSSFEGPGPERMVQLSPDGMLITADEPAHRRQRKIASKAFLPRMVSKRIPVIQRTVDDLIDKVADHGSCELMHDIAFPLTVTMLTDFFGVGQDRIDDIARWGAAATALLGGTEEQVAAGTQATLEFFAFMQGHIDQRRAALAQDMPLAEDVLTALITASDDETASSFTDLEVLAAAHQFYTAGFETTATAIGNGVYRLCINPDERGKLENDWSLLDNACEEILRYDSPVEGTFRTAARPQVLNGVPIPAGGKIRVVYASANHDAARFADPDSFRIDRPVKELRAHLGFATGPHTCIGSALARAELRTAIEGILKRLPDLHLDLTDPPTKSTALTVCGFTGIPLRWDPATVSPRLWDTSGPSEPA